MVLDIYLFKFYGVSVSKIFFKSLSTVSKLIEGVTENTLELLSLCCLMALADCVFFIRQFPPGGGCATLQVWSLRGHATDQLLLTL